MSSKTGDDVLPAYTVHAQPAAPAQAPRRRSRAIRFLLLLLTSFVLLRCLWSYPGSRSSRSYRPANADNILAQCRALTAIPSPPADFAERRLSDRFVPGTAPTLIVNATLWLGEDRVVSGDLYMDGGVIRAIGYVPRELSALPGVVVVNAEGAWVTPGIVDLHSHLGVDSAPSLEGSGDTNSILGAVQPWLRSLDGLNTHDLSYALSISGGITSALVLPGSADNIGGQAFMIKLRSTEERSSSAMVVEPPWGLWNGTDVDPEAPVRWRHMKHACGENPSRLYDSTRMDSIWRFRQAYAAAAVIRDAQDAYCTSALSGNWLQIASTPFPYDLALEALVDTLRGRVKVNVHCYEAVDFDGIVRLTNEFKFPIAAFHHAHEAYLVPDLIKKTWGGAPAVAMFATNARYKREAYRGSEFAPKILADNGVPVVMKSDHPVLNSRYLLYEAQQAFFYGLNASLALAAVTSTPAAAAGFSHRLGALKVGHDADVVVWDSHPLQLGATPLQVYIDGIPQLSYAEEVVVEGEGGVMRMSLKERPVEESDLQSQPEVPDYEREAQEVLEFEGEPPLRPREVLDEVLFTSVSSLWTTNEDSSPLEVALSSSTEPGLAGEVLVRNGSVVCWGQCSHVALSARVVDLEGGSLAPGLTTYGSYLGLIEIRAEPSTNDGMGYDVFGNLAPAALGGSVLRAVDGVQFSGKDMLIAHRSGVTTAVTAPASYGFLSGLAGAFATGAWNKAEKGSVVQPVTALHVSVGHKGSRPSISAQIAALRHLLSASEEGSPWWDVAHGSLPLVIAVESADIMSTLILLKQEVEIQFGSTVKWTFAGANEAWMVAKNIADDGIGVILAPSRTYPAEWEKMRTLPGVPITEDTNISILLTYNVTVAIGVVEEWDARNTRFDAIWAYRDGHGKISKSQALALVSSNVNRLLGMSEANAAGDLVAYQGGDFFSTRAKVVGAVSERRGITELF